jgi:hypothetical protein
MKRELRGKKNACSTILLNLAANGLQHVFEKWVERCKKYIACQGRYFGKKRPSPHLHKVPIRNVEATNLPNGPRIFHMH